MYSTIYKVELKDDEKTLKEYGIGKGAHLKLEWKVKPNLVEEENKDEDVIEETEVEDEDDDPNYDENDENLDTSSSDSDYSDEEEENECNDFEFAQYHELIMTDCRLKPCLIVSHSSVKDGIPKQEKNGEKVFKEIEVDDEDEDAITLLKIKKNAITVE